MLGTLAVKGIGPLPIRSSGATANLRSFSPAGSGSLSLRHTPTRTAGTFAMVSELISDYDGDTATAEASPSR